MARWQNGWVALSGSTFYAEPNGKLASGWHQVGGSRYYFDPSTYAMRTGWILDNGSWYWLGSNGAMANRLGIRCAWYYLNADGSMKTGWLEWAASITGSMVVDAWLRVFDTSTATGVTSGSSGRVQTRLVGRTPAMYPR